MVFSGWARKGSGLQVSCQASSNVDQVSRWRKKSTDSGGPNILRGAVR